MVLERLYFKRFNNTLSIYFRPSHCYLTGISLTGDWGERVKNLLNMPTHMFYEVVFGMGALMPKESELVIDSRCTNNNSSRRREQEEWFEKAWIYETKKILDMLDVENVYEEVPFEYISKLVDAKRKKDNSGSGLSFFSSDVDDKLLAMEEADDMSDTNDFEEEYND